MAPELLRSREAMQVLNMKKTPFYEAAKRGEIPGLRRIGRLIFVSRRELDDWLSGSAAGASK